jgi:hypothetical protein
VTEQVGEHRAARVLPLGPLPRPPDLAQDLGLARHRRAEPRRDLEQVTRDVVVEADGEVALDLVDGQVGLLGKEHADLVDRVVEPVDDGVDLRAQARGEEHGLFEVHAVAQPPEHLGQVGLTDRDPFEQFER